MAITLHLQNQSNKAAMETNVYRAPKGDPSSNVYYKYLISIRRKAIVLTVFTWISPIVLVVLRPPLIVGIFAGCYGLVLWFLALGAAERYKEEAKQLGFGRQVIYARILFIFNLLPFLIGLLNLIGFVVQSTISA